MGSKRVGILKVVGITLSVGTILCGLVDILRRKKVK